MNVFLMRSLTSKYDFKQSQTAQYNGMPKLKNLEKDTIVFSGKIDKILTKIDKALYKRPTLDEIKKFASEPRANRLEDAILLRNDYEVFTIEELNQAIQIIKDEMNKPGTFEGKKEILQDCINGLNKILEKKTT